MVSHEYGDNSLELELSQEELRSLLGLIAQKLISKGEITEPDGVIPANLEAGQPRAFTLPLNSRVVREVFYPDDQELIPSTGSQIEYTTAHRLEPDDPAVYEGIVVRCASRLFNTDITVEDFFIIGRQDDHFTGTIDRDYSKNDRVISPNDFGYDNALDSDDKIVEALWDANALQRPLTLDDAQKLRQLADILGN